MRPIINVEVVIAIHLKPFKLQEELLEDGLCLEGDDAVLVPLVSALQHHPVHRSLDLGKEVSLPRLVANLMHLICNKNIRTVAIDQNTQWDYDNRGTLTHFHYKEILRSFK